MANKINYGFINERELEKITSLGMTFLDNIDPIKLRAILYLLFYTGITKKEFTNLKRENINLEEQLIYIKKGTDRDTFEREIPFTKKVKEYIETFFNTYPEENNAFNIKYNNLTRIFNLLKGFIPYKKEFTITTLRYSFGRLLSLKGIPVRIADKLLGYKNKKHLLMYFNTTKEEVRKYYKEKIK